MTRGSRGLLHRTTIPPDRNTKAAAGTRLRHDALVYGSQDEYVAQAVAFLKDGLEAGEGAIVANTRPGLAAMRAALGPDAADVTFVDVSFAYTRPARTLAAYHQAHVEQSRYATSWRVVADVQVGDDPGEWDLWMGYEAVFTRSFAHIPAWVVCTYDANGLSDRVLEGVWRTHPEVLADGAWSTSDEYEEPEALLRRVMAQPVRLSGLRSIGFGRDTEEFRERLALELAAEEVPEAKALDMLVAAGELFTNAVEHGGGVKEVRAGWVDGRFVCEIVDRGAGFDDPTAGYIAPRPGVGRGLWVARQLTWRIELFQSADGFTARIWL